jgi:DMSO/TMAO reductase YedYZ molybdopterin-dependent catalytic subunit
MTYAILMGLVMVQKKPLFLELVLVGLLIAGVLSSSTIAMVAGTGGNSEILESVEITEYEGKDLSSIDDFYENSIKGPQYIDNETYRLVITGLVDNVSQYTYDDVINNNQHFKKVVTLHCVEGWSVTILWEGVLVEDLIEEAGVNPETTTVIFHAYDGYSTSLPLDYVTSNNIMISYKMNNVTLPPERGFPFELVAESKWGYKWIKWITAIELSDNADYRGYWESRGFSNEGNFDEDFFETGIPEFPAWVSVPLFAATTVMVISIIIYRKRLSHKKD